MSEGGDKLRILALHSWRTSGSIFIEQVRAVHTGLAREAAASQLSSPHMSVLHIADAAGRPGQSSC